MPSEIRIEARIATDHRGGEHTTGRPEEVGDPVETQRWAASGTGPPCSGGRVDGHPVPQDEPPARYREDEAYTAAKDAAHPHIVAARAGHHGNQGRVGYGLEHKVEAGRG